MEDVHQRQDASVMEHIILHTTGMLSVISYSRSIRQELLALDKNGLRDT